MTSMTGQRSDDRFDKLEALIETQGTKLGGLIAEQGNKLEGRISRLEAQVAEQGNKLGARIDTLHSQVGLVAEGHAALVDHIVEMKGGIERLEAGQTGLVLRMSAVEWRVTEVERTQKVVLAEVRGLATRK